MHCLLSLITLHASTENLMKTLLVAASSCSVLFHWNSSRALLIGKSRRYADAPFLSPATQLRLQTGKMFPVPFSIQFSHFSQNFFCAGTAKVRINWWNWCPSLWVRWRRRQTWVFISVDVMWSTHEYHLIGKQCVWGGGGSCPWQYGNANDKDNGSLTFWSTLISAQGKTAKFILRVWWEAAL